MNIRKWIITCVGVAVAAAAVWFFISSRTATTTDAAKNSYYCPMHPDYTSDRPGKCPICNMDLVKRKVKEQSAIDVYYCPMHPDYNSDRPGKCPICNMELVKRKPEAEAAHNHRSDTAPAGYASVDLDTRQRQLLGIRTEVVKTQPSIKTVHAYGYVAHTIDLYKVQNEFVDAYREFVTIYRDYRRFENRRRNWEAHRELQTKLLEAEHKLSLLGLNEAQISKLREIKWWQSWDQPELRIYRDTNNYWVFAQVFERDLGFLEAGQNVNVRIPAYHEDLKGIVRSIGGYVDPETRTVRVLIEIQGHRGELTANMLAYVDIHSDLGNHLVVPASAVMDLGEHKVVFVERGEGRFEPVEIGVYFLGDGYWAVKSGLKENDHVVVDGNFLLDSESRMRSKFKGEDGSLNGEVAHGQH